MRDEAAHDGADAIADTPGHEGARDLLVSGADAVLEVRDGRTHDLRIDTLGVEEKACA